MIDAHHPLLTAIASGKGGTGKTFIAATLSQALANEGERVLLFDGDLGLSNIAVQLGLAHADRFAAVLAGQVPVHEAAIPFCRRANKPGGVDVLAGPSGTGAFVNVDAATVMRTVAALRLSVGYDRVVLDLAAGVEDTVMRFATASDECFVVLTPDPAALTDAYAFIKLYIRRAGGRVPGFLVNQAANAREAGQVAAALTSSCENFLNIAPNGAGFVRRDAKVADAVRRQAPLLKLHPQCPAADDIISLAREVRGAERSRSARAAGTR
jgi:flagellar biosynthesis protein FlhG